MKKPIKIHGRVIEYGLKTSTRARRMRVTVSRDNGVVVTAPKGVHESVIERFLQEKADWILKTMARLESLGPPLLPQAKRGDYVKYKQQALALAVARIDHFNHFYGFRLNSIGIRNQKTRWGSCSRQRNLNFNYKIALLPSALCDYIIVHEICHLKEMNHSPKFWALVEKIVPNYKQLRRQLRKNSMLV